MDTLSRQQRHDNMAAVKGRDTKPEMIVRKYLWRCGFRYRVNSPRLPGHGHEGCRYYVGPKTHTDFWVKKVARNKERDRREQQQLARMGWHCITVWECELKKGKRKQTLASLAYTLNHIYLEDRSVSYQIPEDGTGMYMAAEPEAEY